MHINFHFLPGNDTLWVSSMSKKGIVDKIGSCDISEFIEIDLLLNDNICDFSAVKFFADEEIIIAKRDFFGTIPLFFKIKENYDYIFSDSLPDLLDSNGIQLNEERIHYYLHSDDLDKIQKTHLTFFEHIYQVPAGCIARISASGVEISSLNYLRALSKKNLVDVIKANLCEVVNQKSKVSYNVSGGIDSTGLASIHEYYFSSMSEANFCALETPFVSCNEKEYQKSFEERYNKEIDFFEINPTIKEITESYVKYSLHPPLLYSVVSVFDSLLNGLKANNVEKLIMGHGGDNILGHGYEYIAILKKERNYDDIKKFVEKISEGDILKSKFAGWETFSKSKKFSSTLMFFVFPSLRDNLTYFASFLWNYMKGGGNLGFFCTHLLNSVGNKFKLESKLFKEKTLEKKQNIFKINYQSNRYPNIQNWVTSSTFEVFFNLSRLYNIGFVFPYFSTELLATSLNYSDKDKFGEGLGRAHFRAELAGIMPDKVRNRIGKTSFDELFIKEINNFILQVGDIPPSHRFWKYVHKETYLKLVSYLLDDDIAYHKKTGYAHLIHKSLNMKVWLDCIIKHENNEIKN